MRLTELDYYAALDVLPGTPVEQIERAYRFAMQNYSADSLATYGLIDEAERKEIEVFLNEAMRVLGNVQLRAQYDRGLRERNVYTDVQMGRAANLTHLPEGPGADPQLPILPPRVAAVPTDAAPTDAAPETESVRNEPAPAAPEPAPGPAQPPGTVMVEAKQGRDRSWWPFSEKDKTADSAPAPLTEPLPTAPQPAAVSGAGEDTAPLERPAAPVVIPALDGRPIGGGELRQIREARGLKLEEIGSHTKISMSTLRAIEDSNFKFLPAPVYLKGFLRTYCKMLQIDADKVIADYMRNFDAHRQA